MLGSRHFDFDQGAGNGAIAKDQISAPEVATQLFLAAKHRVCGIDPEGGYQRLRAQSAEERDEVADLFLVIQEPPERSPSWACGAILARWVVRRTALGPSHVPPYNCWQITWRTCVERQSTEDNAWVPLGPAV